MPTLPDPVEERPQKHTERAEQLRLRDSAAITRLFGRGRQKLNTQSAWRKTR